MKMPDSHLSLHARGAKLRRQIWLRSKKTYCTTGKKGFCKTYGYSIFYHLVFRKQLAIFSVS